MPNEKLNNIFYNDWCRGGAETYILPFSVSTTDNKIRKYIMKAITTFSIAMSLDELLEEWVARRKAIESMGVKTPELYYYGKGIIIEDYISHNFAEYISKTKTNNSMLLKSFFKYVFVLSQLGYIPNNAFGDLRTDGKVVIPIDFGEDIGSIGNNTQNIDDVFQDSLNWLKKYDCVLSEEDIVMQKKLFNLSTSKENIN